MKVIPFCSSIKPRILSLLMYIPSNVDPSVYAPAPTEFVFRTKKCNQIYLSKSDSHGKIPLWHRKTKNPEVLSHSLVHWLNPLHRSLIYLLCNSYFALLAFLSAALIRSFAHYLPHSLQTSWEKGFCP